MTVLTDLTTAYRRSQLQLRNVSLRELITMWPTLNLRDVEGTFPAFALGVAGIVTQRRVQSANSALGYLHAARLLAGITDPAPAAPISVFDPIAFSTSLRVTSLVAVKVGMRAGFPLEKAGSNALVQAAGMVGRYVTDAGRETVINNVLADPSAQGWRRVTSGGSCDFCTMLAGRGAVYREDSGAFRAHDHCGCTAEPVY